MSRQASRGTESKKMVGNLGRVTSAGGPGLGGVLRDRTPRTRATRATWNDAKSWPGGGGRPRPLSRGPRAALRSLPALWPWLAKRGHAPGGQLSCFGLPSCPLSWLP